MVCAQALKHRVYAFSKGRERQGEVAGERLLQFQGSLVRIIRFYGFWKRKKKKSLFLKSNFSVFTFWFYSKSFLLKSK